MGILIMIVFIAVWGGCAASGGVLGFMLGWLPAWVIVQIIAMFTD